MHFENCISQLEASNKVCGGGINQSERKMGMNYGHSGGIVQLDHQLTSDIASSI